MATRKIKDAKDLSTNELVYFKGHAKATYMSDGRNVEEAIHQIETSEGDGITAETDPVFLSSPAASITEEKKAEWDNKVDKVSGKQLSTEDFTSALKSKLEGLSNYDDTQIQAAITLLRNDLDKLISGDTTTAIKTFNEIIAFLDGVNDTQSLSSIIASIEQQIAGKMDKVTLSAVATSGSYNDLKDKPTIPSEQVNADWNATSGKAQILNKPTIPAAVTESIVSGWGFTKNTGTVTGVKVNGSTKNPSNGVVDLGSVLTEHQSLKTINGQSIVGSGDIEISGGGDSLYFTEFTVEDFVGAMASSIQLENKAALVQAIKDNKIICVPFANPAQGYKVASARLEKYDDGDVVYSVDLYLSYNNGLHVRYIPYHVDSLQFVSLSTFSNTVVCLDTPSVDGEVACTYVITSVVEDSLDVACNIQIGETMRVMFTTGDTTPIIYIYAGELSWANGVIPEIEPNTGYELSLSPAYDFCNVVLTAFKPE